MTYTALDISNIHLNSDDTQNSLSIFEYSRVFLALGSNCHARGRIWFYACRQCLAASAEDDATFLEMLEEAFDGDVLSSIRAPGRLDMPETVRLT